MSEKLLMIIRRKIPTPHYELHYNKRIDFITLDGKNLGPEEVHVVE